MVATASVVANMSTFRLSSLVVCVDVPRTVFAALDRCSSAMAETEVAAMATAQRVAQEKGLNFMRGGSFHSIDCVTGAWVSASWVHDLAIIGQGLECQQRGSSPKMGG